MCGIEVLFGKLIELSAEARKRELELLALESPEIKSQLDDLLLAHEDTATKVSSLRQTLPNQLGRTVKGELDWIVMKALSKERARRYDSAVRLSEDVNAYLNNGVVEARSPTLGYQLRKLYLRNRQVATLVGILSLSTIAVMGVLTWSYVSLVANEKRLEELNRELVESGFARVFELAQSGRLPAARKRLNLLTESSNDDRKIRLYGNIVNLFGNDQERREARDDLIALERDQEDVLVKSMLVLSYIRTGDEWSYHDKVAELFDSKASTYEEYLFRGAAFTFAHPWNACSDLRVPLHIYCSRKRCRAL